MKGIMYVWLVFLIALFVLGFLYVYFADTYQNIIKPPVISNIDSMTTNTTNPQQVLNILDMIWYWIPIIMLIGIGLWAVVNAQREVGPYG